MPERASPHAPKSDRRRLATVSGRGQSERRVSEALKREGAAEPSRRIDHQRAGSDRDQTAGSFAPHTDPLLVTHQALTPHQLLALQRAAGNAAVSKLLQGQDRGEETPASGPVSPTEREGDPDSALIPARPPPPAPLAGTVGSEKHPAIAQAVGHQPKAAPPASLTGKAAAAALRQSAHATPIPEAPVEATEVEESPTGAVPQEPMMAGQPPPPPDESPPPQRLPLTGRSPEPEAAAEADRTEALSRRLAGSFGATGDETQSALAARVNQMLSGLSAAAEQASARIRGSFSAEQRTVDTEVDQALARVAAAKAQQHQQIQTVRQSERRRLQDAHQANRQTAANLIQEVRAQTAGGGEREAVRAMASSEERAQAILNEGRAIGGTGDAPLVEARTNAATRIAEHAARQCRQMGSDLARRVREEAAHQETTTYDGMLGTYHGQFDQTVADTEKATTDAAVHASARIDTLAQAATASIKAMGKQSNSALASREQTAERQVQDWLRKASASIRQSGRRAGDQFAAQVRWFKSSLEGRGSEAAVALRGHPAQSGVGEAGAALRQTLQEGHDQGRAALHGSNGRALADLDNASAQLQSQLANHVGESASSAAATGGKIVAELRSAAGNAQTGMQHAAASFQQALETSAGTATQKMAQATAQFQSELQVPHQKALKAFAQLVNDGLASQDQLLAKTRGDMASAGGQIDTRYHQLKGEAEQQSKAESQPATPAVQRGIWGSITGFFGGLVDSAKKWFAKTFGAFWGGLIFGILEALVIVVVGVLVLVAVGAALVWATVAAATAAIVVVVVALCIAIPLAIYNRFQEFYADNPGQDAGFWRGLGLVALGILDITGIPYIVEAAVGRRAFGKELHGFERGERLGMGLVFFIATIVAAKNLLRAKPKIGVDEGGKVPEQPVPKPDETAPVGMTPKLQAIRSALKDPRAIVQFDAMFERIGDTAKMEKIIDGFEQTAKQGGKSVEQRLIDDWEAANPTPRGAALDQVPGLKARAEALKARVKAFLDANPKVGNKWLKAIDGEIANLDRMLDGKVEATPERVEGSANNLNGVEGELEVAEKATGVTGVSQTFPLDGTGKVEVDVVTDEGKTWIDSKRVKPFGTESADWKGGPGKQGLETQARELVRAASQNPLPDGTIPKVVIEFPLGVSDAVAAELAKLGVEVRGPVVPITPVPVPVGTGEDEEDE